MPGLRMIGTARDKAGVLSFVVEDVHPHDVGHHPRPGRHRRPHRPPLRQPVMERFGVPATARASLAFYNTRAEVDALTAGIRKVREVFA